ncbi:8-amino-7-oxononanoate synthase [Streptomyces rapamycinicus]|uniref:8-amino-7-oxononanoate synthase n=2 Tax=Streptomyces rapamycinicus TaxID=1226757 RepID=A0A0A0N443_STRRN|nr:8-amino-7-oxononanoate synthase [Streptomyces rapamycinicus]AGP53187.1 8-amino-7-oxononanoate synthase [Streptomyces rapamycinicus NRRL 5491]MBB4780669.1 8-amino-7-oxononanoate synthase [Streptomyces rapamycinicus]RLV74680.1 8-amino-7-oxononanoate synthase [Streptomyces rapamycinicus NRRL 5491]UTO61379.1 8-amino-7-oxononanoate synthase [Streptomyces rapamycinicus]UTP29326.1 8-amino-7-oxononanoate synthase [Streptomyces rapamycinicus NRRL 5491]
MPQDRHDAFAWIDAQRERRDRAGLVRRLSPRPADSPLLDLASNDYLGLARHPEVTAAAAVAAHRWGAGSTGSRLVTGSTELHTTLERELAEFCGFEAALVFSSGYAANLAAVSALSGRDALVVSDADNHASLIDGCRLSRAEIAVVPHADPDAVRKALDAAEGAEADAGEAGEARRRALVVSDAVFSVDGDAAPLAALAGAARPYGAALVVDEAHGLGVLGEGGRGAVHEAGLAGAPDVVVTATLSKSLGSQGGAVLGPARVIDHLVNSARTFIFDTGLNPAAVGAALASLRLLRREPERAARVRTVAMGLYGRLTAAGLAAVRPDASVVSVRAPSPEEAVRWAADCRAAGLMVGCFRPPSVPDGVSRLRLTSRGDLTEEQVEGAVDVIVRTAPTA